MLAFLILGLKTARFRTVFPGSSKWFFKWSEWFWKTIQTIRTNDQDKRTDVREPTSGNSNKLSIVGPLFKDMLICQRKKMSDRVPAANVPLSKAGKTIWPESPLPFFFKLTSISPAGWGLFPSISAYRSAKPTFFKARNR